MQSIASEDIIRRIRAENPWWASGHSVYETVQAMTPRAYLDSFMHLVERPVRRAVILLGPRRVGKTVMIHHGIQSLLTSGVKPEAICYVSVDSPVYNGLRIEQLLEYYGQAVGIDYHTEPVYIFFDEIQYLRKWEVQLKSIVDNFDKVRCIASGSAAAALRLKSQESGAGRFTDFLLPPLTFFEYLNLLGKGDMLDGPMGGIPRKTGPASFVAVDINRLNDEFLRYLNFGGYPEVIFSPEIQADPVRFIKSDIIDKVLLRDLPSLYGIEDVQELNYLFTTLAYNSGNEISLGELSQNSGVAKNTIKRYIDYLEAAFLIRIVHRIDHNAKRFQRATHFKVYLTNPSMRAALFSPIGPNDKEIGRLVETALFAQWFHSPDPLYYARWGDGEVDMVKLRADQKPAWAVEMKWSDRVVDRRSELVGLTNFLNANKLDDVLVTTRTETASDVVDGRKWRFVPASVYCYAVGHNLIHGLRSQTLAQQLEFETAAESGLH